MVATRNSRTRCSPQWRKATGTRKVSTLINTHWHPAQTGSNETLGRQGAQIIAHEVTRLYLARPSHRWTTTGCMVRCTEKGRPTKTTRTTGSLQFAGQPVEYGYLPAAHTNGDLYIHFPDANLHRGRWSGVQRIAGRCSTGATARGSVAW